MRLFVSIVEKKQLRKRWAVRGLNLAFAALLAGGCQSIQPASAPIATVSPAFDPNPAPSPIVTVSASIPHAAAPESSRAGTVLPNPEAEGTIDLAAAFRLAGLDSPTINLAREVVREAVARQRAAQVLLLPNLTAGMSFHQHTGNLQGSTGLIRSVDSQDLYAGAGARALAAETVAYPGVRIFSHLGDAAYESLAARQQVEVRRSDAFATENQVLLQVAGAYFDLLGAEVRLEALRNGEEEIDEIVRRTKAFADRGQGRIGNANRAEARAELLRRQRQDTEGDMAAASARLAGLLSLNPATRLRTPGGAIQPVTLIDENEPLQVLIERSLVNRPEIRARLQAIAEARTRVRQEQVRPLLPTISVGFRSGTFGGGSNLTAAGIAQPGGGVQVSPSFGNFGGRTDFDVFAVWTLQNGGIGNRAIVRRAEALVGEATAELDRTTNEVRREVAEALADAQAASRQFELSRRQLAIAEDGYREEMVRTKQTLAQPLELIDSFRQLNTARQGILRAVVAHNAAQYRLFVAVGFSPLQLPDGDCAPKPNGP
jgi:outer membrane protein TolC